MMLQSATGPDGEWEDWSEIITPADRERADSLVAKHPERWRISGVDFSCKVCGVQCPIAPDLPDRAVCELHCEDHDYEYDRDFRRHCCKHCGKDRPEDWNY